MEPASNQGVPVWVVIIILGLVGSLAGLLWRAIAMHDRSIDDRIDNHIQKIEDHEARISTLEEEMRTAKGEIKTLRDRWHQQVAHVSHTLADWFNEVVKLVNGKK